MRSRSLNGPFWRRSIVFVCAVELFAALSCPALLGVADAVQQSFDTISVAVSAPGI